MSSLSQISLTLMQSSSLSSVAPKLISRGTNTQRATELSVFEAEFGKHTAILELVSGLTVEELISGLMEADGAIASGLYVVFLTGGLSGVLLVGSIRALSEGRLFSKEVLGRGAFVVVGVSCLAGWFCTGGVERAVVATADDTPAVLVLLAGKFEEVKVEAMVLEVDKLVSPVSGCVAVLPTLPRRWI